MRCILQYHNFLSTPNLYSIDFETLFLFQVSFFGSIAFPSTYYYDTTSMITYYPSMTDHTIPSMSFGLTELGYTEDTPIKITLAPVNSYSESVPLQILTPIDLASFKSFNEHSKGPWSDKEELILQGYYLKTSRVESFAHLKDFVDRLQSSASPYLRFQGKHNIAPRVDIIKELEGNPDPLLILFRRIHIHFLYQEASGGENGWYMQDFDGTTPEPRAPGRPTRLDANKTTLKILKDMGYTETDPDWQNQFSYINRLRRMGERLSRLVSDFGLGILGLLPLGPQAVIKDIVEFNDSFLRDSPDHPFQDLIKLLHRGHHEHPRLFQSSQFIEPVVHGIIYGRAQFDINIGFYDF